MSSPSNLYAEKIYAEHPQFLWALDDKADYVSIISESERDMSGWTIENGTSEETEELSDAPFPDSIINKIVPNSIGSEVFSTILVSPELININELNQELKTFSIGSYIYTNSPYILSIEIGYRYYDDALESYVDILKTYDASLKDRWYFISETFSPDFQDSQIKLVIKINYLGSSEELTNYILYLNGISVGQWCEEFQSSSLGVTTISLPSDIALDSSDVIQASAYGLAENFGYYFVNDNSLSAKNFGIPMVFGSENITKLYDNQNKPSLIIPSNGMLSSGRRYQDFTLEFWLRTNSSSITSKRIVGPISSTDGLYLNGPFLILKIDNNYSSYYVGQWERPMLIDWRYTNNLSTVLLNGEEVISLVLDSENLNLPEKINELGKDQDWIGFYAYTDIQPIELDCIAIYPYLVPSLVAKRRFVYGQGVQYPENLNASYGGSTVLFDYAFADYTKNYNYPDLGSWSQGSLDNVMIEDGYLKSPNFSVPQIFINDSTKTELNLLTDCAIIQNEASLFLDLRPSPDWESINSYLYFDSIILNGELPHSFYGIFKKTADTLDKQVLIRLEDQSSNYFSIELYETGLRYKLKNQKKSYAKWLSEALIRCRKTISQIGTITRFSDNKIKGALFTGRRTGGYAFLLLQNLLVSQEYGDCIGTSSVDAWYDLTKMKANFKLNPVGTHAHELSMVTSALFPELDENSLNLPLTQLLGHYLYYKQSNNSQPIPMLPDTLGTAAFMKAGNIIQVNGKRFLEIILNARQDSGKLEDFVKVMAKYDFWNPVMASEIDEPATLEKAWNMTYKDALGENCPEKEESNFPYKTFGAGGFFGDSEKAYNKTKDSISMAVKAIRVYKDYKASRVFPVKLGDGTGKLSINVTLNEDSLKKAENRAQKIKNEGVKNLGKNKASQIAEIQKLWDETTNEILQAQKGGRRSKSRSRKH